jgi:dethiobiotin synthetase
VSGCFVTGTDTGVGKTVLTAAITSALHARGVSVAVRKPILTGLDEPADPDWPRDDEMLARAGRCDAADVVFASFGPPVAPHLALELAGSELDLVALLAWLRGAVEASEALVVEGVGGLLVPLTESYDVRALAFELDLPILIAARTGLGTINHTLLTLGAARGAGLTVAGVVLTPWPDEPGVIEHSNRRTIEKVGGVEVFALPRIARADPELLADAASALPLERWLGLR